MERGNVIFQEEWEFWLVTFLQALSIVLLPAAMQNIIAVVWERRNA